MQAYEETLKTILIMDTREYLSPSVRVVKLTQRSIICASGNTEGLSGSNFDWSGTGGSTEPLTGSDYGW